MEFCRPLFCFKTTSPSPLLACEKHSLLENSMAYSSSKDTVAVPSLKQEDAHFGAERALARAERSKTLAGKNKPGLLRGACNYNTGML